jgi:hypothetical protein
MPALTSRVLYERRVKRMDDSLSLNRRGAGYWDTDVDLWWSIWQAAVRSKRRQQRQARMARVSRSAFTQDENGNRYPIPRTPGKRRALRFSQK